MKILHGKHNRQYKLRSWELKLKNKTKQKTVAVVFRDFHPPFLLYFISFAFSSSLLISSEQVSGLIRV